MFKPTTFGKFFLYEKLAIGGMAEIFKAKLYGIAGFEKTLVVKQILPEYASDAEFVKMFIDEANIAVSLTHGNIVPVYELGKIADRYYIAMEFVDGENLETILDQVAKVKRDIPVHLCVEIAIEVCKGLDYAHRRASPEGVSLGIVHRDVSPQNVMVSFDGEVKIVDFGIAKAASKLSMTRIGTLKGKFGYMSPEQAFGNEVDRRTDVYAIGIVLYESLTGRRLYEAEGDLELLKKVRAGVITPPSQLSPRVPPELDKLVLKALSKDINARYQYASEFQGDLQRWLYSRPANPQEETLGGFLRSLFRRGTGSSPAAAMPVEVGPSPDETTTSEDARRPEVSFAQSDAIAQLLHEASREAKRVMGDETSNEPGTARVSPFHAQAVPSEFDDISTNVQKIPVKVSVDEDAPTATGADNVSPAPLQAGDDVIEFDEISSGVSLRLSPGASVEERPQPQGPIVRVPSRSARVSKAPLPPPPWPVDGGVIPEPSIDTMPPGSNGGSRVEATRPAGPPPPPPPRVAKNRPISRAAEVSVAPSDAPLFQRSVTQPAKQTGARVLIAVIVVFLLVGAAASYALRGPIMNLLAGDVPSGSPPATPEITAVVDASPGTSPAVTPVVTPTASATPAAPTTRRASFETTPSGVAVFIGSKKLGTTPFSATVSSDDITVRYARAGYRELKRNYPAGTGVLKATESLDAIPTPTPTARPTPVPVIEYGTISVNATPWGKVKIDGAFIKNTPLIKHRLKAGSHEIEVSNPDFPRKTSRKTLVVHANADEDPIIVSFE